MIDIAGKENTFMQEIQVFVTGQNDWIALEINSEKH